METENNEKTVVSTAPDGGWGYLIVLAVTLAFVSTIVPLASFGLIFGGFLASVGDETTGTSLANGIILTVSNLVGLVTSHLLEKYSFRTVALLGAFLYSIGSFATIFISSLPQMIISFGIIQGLGIGLLFPACMTALTTYFDKKLNLVNSIAQTIMTASTIGFPRLIRYTTENFGFRGTLSLLAAFSFNTILAAALLQPVQWHLKQVPVAPLLKSEKSSDIRKSIISIADRPFSVTNLHRASKKGCWEIVAKSLNLSLFQDPAYMNLALGLALSFVSDITFLALIPLLLHNSGFDNNEAAFLMTVYFSSDLLSRILLSIVSAFCKLNNRLIFLTNCFLLVIVRTLFLAYDTYTWKLGTLAILGFLRCFIQTPLPLVIADEYPDTFSTAFSLYMVVLGVVSLISAPLISWVKYWTHSDAMVVHLLSAAYMTCVITWMVELIYKKIKTAQSYILVFNYRRRQTELISEENALPIF